MNHFSWNSVSALSVSSDVKLRCNCFIVAVKTHNTELVDSINLGEKDMDQSKIDVKYLSIISMNL